MSSNKECFDKQESIVLAGAAVMGFQSTNETDTIVLQVQDKNVIFGKEFLQDPLEITINSADCVPSARVRKHQRSNMRRECRNILPASHPSVTTNLARHKMLLSLPLCPLCIRNRYSRHESLLMHFNMCHAQKAITVAGFTLLCCKLSCGGLSINHYHCPGCYYLTQSKRLMRSHVAQHQQLVHHHNSNTDQSDVFSGIDYTPSNISGEQIQHISCVKEISQQQSSMMVNLQIDKKTDKNDPQVLQRKNQDFHEIKNISKNTDIQNFTNSFEYLLEREEITITTTDNICKAHIETVSETLPMLYSKDGDFLPTGYLDGISSIASDQFIVPEQHVALYVHEIDGEHIAEPDSDLLLCLPDTLQQAYDRLSGSTHCYLCSDTVQYETELELELHFYRHHVRHSVTVFRGCLGLVCHLNCGCGGHLHCPLCVFVDTAPHLVVQHYQAHHGAEQCEDDHANKKDIRKIKAHYPPILSALLMVEVDADLSFIPAEYPSPSLLSIVTDAYDVYVRLQPLHCLLCGDGREYRRLSRLQAHFQRSHIKRCNTTSPIPSLMCRLSCKGFTRGHYHCPFCLFVMHDLTKMCVHQSRLHNALLAQAAQDRRMGRTMLGAGPPAGGGAPQELVKTCDGNTSRAGEAGVFVRAASIVTSLDAIRATISLPDCLLCQSTADLFTSKRLHSHFESNHLKLAVRCGPFHILACRLHCAKYMDRGHYHCPWCGYTCHDKKVLVCHADKHSTKMAASKLGEEGARIARAENPDFHGQYKVTLQHATADERKKLQTWQLQFNNFLKSDFAPNIKRHTCVMAHHRRKRIIDHILYKAPLEPHLVRYILFKNFHVVNVPEVGLKNCLVEPVVVYKGLGTAGDPLSSFYERYRRVACVEEFFGALLGLHVQQDGCHNTEAAMTVLLRAQFVFLPLSLVPKFLALCPVCRSSGGSPPGVSPADGTAQSSSYATVSGTSDAELPLCSRPLAVLQVNIVDMSDHPDDRYHYIVHCQDRCTQLHFLFPLQQLSMRHIAAEVVRRVLAVTGLPAVIGSNSGLEFVEALIGHIADIWTEPCTELLSNSTEEHITNISFPQLASDDVIKELTARMVYSSQNWTSWLGHLQYTLNTRTCHQDASPFQTAFHRTPSLPCVASQPLVERASNLEALQRVQTLQQAETVLQDSTMEHSSKQADLLDSITSFSCVETTIGSNCKGNLDPFVDEIPDSEVDMILTNDGNFYSSLVQDVADGNVYRIN